MAEQTRAIRLFLDSGVIIEGCFANWGAARAALILATVRASFTVVLAEVVEREIQRSIARKVASLDPSRAEALAEGIASWLDRVRVERWPLPSSEEIRAQAPAILPILRHVNDLPAVVTAIRVQPDWVLSTNTEHWNERLAARSGLRIATPLAFLRQLRPTEGQAMSGA